jgi:hypothetical protein
VKTRYAPAYDLFKLIVAIILTVILIYLLLEESNKRFAALEDAMPSPTEMSQSSLPTQTLQIVATPSAEISAPDEVAPTETPLANISPVPAPSEQPTAPVTSSDPNDCPANPTRLEVGLMVNVLDWLNFRTGPGLQYEIQSTNKPGTEMEVIGGPVCTIKSENPPSAYLWWNVRMETGQEGWSAEAPLNFPNYFLEPK